MSRLRFAVATAEARMIYLAARLLLHLPDCALLGLIGLARRLPGVAGGPAGDQLHEVALILRSGEPYSTILRDLIYKARPHRAICTIRGALIYGSEEQW
ncbi:MAG: hypothetical protein P9M14_00725 [Candidatus Alcyoniella australis]|nr:hypothetical protein [Candidatus Alcyoniella australis]